MFEIADTMFFRWPDLHGKQLTILVGEDNGTVVVSGIDENGVTYILHTEEDTQC